MSFSVFLRRQIKRQLHKLGLDLRYLNPEINPAYQLLKGLSCFNVDLIFDVGANIGQFVTDLRLVGYKDKVVSFEPLSDAHKKLLKIAKKDSRWIVHSQGAIGDYDGVIEINVAGNSLSSSVLPMLEAHSIADKSSAYIGSEKVPIHKLDSIASQYLSESSRFFIKIDTQGFEWQVLDGATEILRKAQGVLCELSLVPLYAGQHLWLEIIRRMEIDGFQLWSLQTGFADPHDGRTLQIDAIFFKKQNYSFDHRETT